MTDVSFADVPPAEPQFDLPPPEAPPPPLPPRPTFPRLLLWLAGGVAACGAAALAGELAAGDPLYLFDDLKNKPWAFQGGMTALAAFLMVAAASFLVIGAQELKASGGTGDRRLLACAAGLALLAFDDVVMVHEWISKKLAGWGVAKPGDMDHDVYVFAVYGVIALVLGAFALPVVWRHRRALPALGFAALFLIGNQWCDAIQWDTLEPAEQRWLGPLEESLKFLGAISFALFGHALQREIRVAARPW